MCCQVLWLKYDLFPFPTISTCWLQGQKTKSNWPKDKGKASAAHNSEVQELLVVFPPSIPSIHPFGHNPDFQSRLSRFPI